MLKKIIYLLLTFLFITTLALLFLYNFLIQHEVTYASMEPNIAPEMICFFLPNPYDNAKDPRRGDVVLIPFCNNSVTHLCAKRVIGLPGDTIIITDSTVSVNDQLLERKLYATHGDYIYYIEKNGEAKYNVAYDSHSQKRYSFPPDTIYVSNYQILVLNDSRKRIWNSVEEILLITSTVIGKSLFTF